MVIALTGSATMAGLSVGLIGLSRFLVSYPIGKITDTYGRKPGILFGLALALVGAIMVGFSIRVHSFALLFVGMLVFGMGMNAAQQMRVAATDMFLPHMRAQALGYIALGSLVGLIISPFVISIAEAVAPGLGQDPLGLPWLMLPVLIVSGMALVSFVHPDPKEIGMHLERYYPDYMPLSAAAGRAASGFQRPEPCCAIVPIRLAIVSNCAAQGNMSIVMVLTSLVLSHHGYSLGVIALLPHVSRRRHVCLHHSARQTGRPLRARQGHVSGCCHRTDRGRPGCLHRTILVGHDRDVSRRAGLGCGQRRGDGDDRRSCRNG